MLLDEYSGTLKNRISFDLIVANRYLFVNHYI